MLVSDVQGNLEEKMVVATYFWEDGELNYKMNAYGYDKLPPDVQEAYGKRVDVVEKWIKSSDEAHTMIMKDMISGKNTEMRKGLGKKKTSLLSKDKILMKFPH